MVYRLLTFERAYRKTERCGRRCLHYRRRVHFELTFLSVRLRQQRKTFQVLENSNNFRSHSINGS